MSQSKKKEKALQHQRALTRARIKALSELKGIPLVSQNEPLCNTTPVIFSIPAAYPKKTTQPDLAITLRSYRKTSCSQRASKTTQNQCQFFWHQKQCQLQQRLALRHDNPFFLTIDSTAWGDIQKRNLSSPLKKVKAYRNKPNIERLRFIATATGTSIYALLQGMNT